MKEPRPLYHGVVFVGQGGWRLVRSGADQVACGMAPTPARRRQPAITIRSEKALARLALLTRDGRSRVEVIEEALERMPLPPAPLLAADREVVIARIQALVASVPKRSYSAMAEIDAEMWDENGVPR